MSGDVLHALLLLTWSALLSLAPQTVQLEHFIALHAPHHHTRLGTSSLQVILEGIAAASAQTLFECMMHGAVQCRVHLSTAAPCRVRAQSLALLLTLTCVENLQV